MKPRMMLLSFPEELVMNILEKLPAKSLMRFKCVQRSWDALFKTKTFIINQSQSQSQSQSNERFIIFRRDSISGSIVLFSYSEPTKTLYQLSDAQNPFPSNNNYFDIWGHCNGVFCLSYYNKNGVQITIMCNPATRDLIHLPPSPHGDDEHESILTYSGFGADPKTFHDFKFIKFYTSTDPDNHDITTAVHVSAEIYSSCTNSWTIIHNLDVDAFINPDTRVALYGFCSSAFFNGVYHWLSLDNSYILCFDFCLSQFRKIYTPKMVEPPLLCHIFRSPDSIAFALDFYIRVEIWILKQDSSWTKLWKIEPDYPFAYGALPIWINDAKFLAQCRDGKLVSCNFGGQTPHQFETLQEGGYFCMQKYVESIAPLSL